MCACRVASDLWPMSGCFTAGRRQVGRTSGLGRPASDRHLADIWIVWVVQNLSRARPMCAMP